MTLDEYNRFCQSIPHSTKVIQWGGAHVWKIGGKVYAIGGWQDSDNQLFVTFKVSNNDYEILKDVEGCRPAPYLASRGMKWIQRMNDVCISDEELMQYLHESYRVVSLNLTKKLQRELRLID